VLAASGITDGSITPAGLRWFIERCIDAGHVDRLDLPGSDALHRTLAAQLPPQGGAL
jgi:exopolyphosphatase/guanosine-5'-triphosphate,3'-diphosphate pyrophosphatase